MATRQEILLGKLALKHELFSKEDLQSAIEYQERQSPDVPLGEILLKRGLLDQEQLAYLLNEQKSILDEPDTQTGVRRGDLLFGKRVVAQKLATSKQVHEAIRLQEKYLAQGRTVSLGEILVARKILTPGQVKQILADQSVTVLSCSACGKNFNVKGYSPEKRYQCKGCGGELGLPASSQVIEVATPPPLAVPAPGPAPVAATEPAATREPDPVIQLPSEGPRLGDTNALDGELEVQPPEETIDDLCSQTIGGYRIMTRLGAGGMGVIYKAEQISLNRIVALKMLNEQFSSNELFLGRFQNEARSVARLNHPNIIQIYDVGSAEGRHFFSMEYVQGENVGDMLDRQGKLPIQKCVEIMIQIAHALHEAHQIGIVHRDIKPDNIMISLKGIAKLADLGIAKNIDLQKDMRITDSEIAIGTPYYMSPEQAQSPNSVDGRSDVYSLGASLYHMLTGRVPFYGVNPAVIFMKLAKEEPPDPLKFNPLIPYSLVLLLRKMMNKDRALRYQDPTELLAALEQALLDIKDPKRRRQTLRLTKEVVKIEATDADTSGLQLIEDDSIETTAPRAPDAPVAAPEPDGETGPEPAAPARAPGAARGAGARSTPGRPAAPPPRRSPLALAAVVGLVLVVVAGAFFATRGGTSEEPAPPPPPPSGPSPEEIQARKAQERLDELKRGLAAATTHADVLRRLRELEQFVETVADSQTTIAQAARREIETANQIADDMFFSDLEARLAPEAGIGTEAPDFPAALALLESGREGMNGPRGLQSLDERIELLRKESRERSQRVLESTRGLETRLESVATAPARSELVTKATSSLDVESRRVLPADAPALRSRRGEIETFHAAHERKQARLERERVLRLEVDALRETLPHHLQPDGAAAKSGIAAVYEREDRTALTASRDGSVARIDDAARAYESLRQAVQRLVDGQIPFTFDKSTGGGHTAVKKYTKLKPEDGIIIYSREPASVIYVSRLSIECFGRLLEGTADLNRGPDRAALGYYLLANVPERRDEAIELLQTAIASDPGLATRDAGFLFAYELDRLEAGLTGAQAPDVPAEERRKRWAALAAAVETLRARWADRSPDHLAAFQVRLDEIAALATRGR